MRGIVFVLCGLFLCSTALAGKPESILGGEENLANEAVAPTAGMAPTAQAPREDLPVVHLNTAKKERAILFSLRGGWSQRNYRLTSEGVNANLPGGSGYEVEGSLEKEMGDTQKLALSFQWGTHAFSGLSDFTPSSFRINSMQAALQYGFLIAGEAAPRAQSWWLWAGYQAKKRTGQAG